MILVGFRRKIDSYPNQLVEAKQRGCMQRALTLDPEYFTFRWSNFCSWSKYNNIYFKSIKTDKWKIKYNYYLVTHEMEVVKQIAQKHFY